ncbi:MAG TPA: ATP-binding cassette domain-containing protein, partial [Xanthobacteraceae bacterium]|nr:ATP-binding cassette domain-containing protein [Xanthobacteraceae bacterium]
MFEVRGLSVSIGPVPIVRDAALALMENEMCGLIGRNGAGKTTVMRALMGALAATGTAELDHVDLLRLPAHRRLAHGVGYMPEDRRLVPEFTVDENIRLPSYAIAMDGVEQRLEWIFSLMPELPKLRD